MLLSISDSVGYHNIDTHNMWFKAGAPTTKCGLSLNLPAVTVTRDVGSTVTWLWPIFVSIVYEQVRTSLLLLLVRDPRFVFPLDSNNNI